MTDRRNMTQQQEKAERQKVDAQIEAVLANPYRSLAAINKPLFCTPNCQHKHKHQYQNDFSKNIKDPRA